MTVLAEGHLGLARPGCLPGRDNAACPAVAKPCGRGAWKGEPEVQRRFATGEERSDEVFLPDPAPEITAKQNGWIARQALANLKRPLRARGSERHAVTGRPWASEGVPVPVSSRR